MGAAALTAIANSAVRSGNSGDSSLQSDGSTASGNGAVALGQGQTATGNGAVAIGDPSVANGTGAVAIGADNQAIGDGAVALGKASSAFGDRKSDVYGKRVSVRVDYGGHRILKKNKSNTT